MFSATALGWCGLQSSQEGVPMELDKKIDQARRIMHEAESDLKCHPHSGIRDLAEYSRLLEAALHARNEYLRLLDSPVADVRQSVPTRAVSNGLGSAA
jgi:hypothetical protein